MKVLKPILFVTAFVAFLVLCAASSSIIGNNF